MKNIDGPTLERFRNAVEKGDSPALQLQLLDQPDLRAILDEPLFAFEKPAVVHAASRGDRETIEVLIDHGADIDRLSSWQAGGFGVLHSTCFDHPELARWLVERGALVDIHAAAGLADHDRMRQLLDADPELIHQRGPDGQLPLHFAADLEVLDFLIERGAELDARCVDHESTAAQWMIHRAPELSRQLVQSGARPDIFLAVALGDEELARRLVEQDPSCLRARLGRPGYDPVRPGNILTWNLGWWAAGGRASPHRVAKAKGNESLYELLLELSPPDVRFLVLAWHGDSERAHTVLDGHPNLVNELEAEEQRFLADACWDGNTAAARILLEAGFDPHLPGDHQSVPLDRAAFHGFAGIIELLLEHDPSPPFDARNEFNSTPLETLIYGSRHGWRDDGDFPRAARLLAEAGHPVSPHDPEQSTEEIKSALSPFVNEDIGRSRRHTDGDSPVDDAVLGGLEVMFDPNPTDLYEHPRHAGDERPGEWVWYYRTQIHNRSDRALKPIWLEAFFFENGQWIPGNGRGRALDAEQILELFSEGNADDDGSVPPGASVARPVAWLTGDGPVRQPVKWAVVAEDDEGREFWAEAEIRTVPYGLRG